MVDIYKLGASNSSVVNGLKNPSQLIRHEKSTNTANLSKSELNFELEDTLAQPFEVILHDTLQLGEPNSSVVN